MKHLSGIFSLVLAAFGLTGFGFTAPGAGRGPMPDLVVGQISFETVHQETDISGQKYWIFNVIVQVKNQGAAAAGASKLLLERNSGPGGAFQQACATCLIDVAAVPAGGAVTLPPRQFNNAGGAASVFRATIDSQHAVAESNEGNNILTAEFKTASVELNTKVPKIPNDKFPALKSDLTVTLDFQNITSNVSGGTTTWTFDVVATVKNLGPGSSPACEMVFQRAPISDPKGSVFISGGFRPVPALAPNAQTVVSVTGLTWIGGTVKRIYFADVDYSNMVDEIEEHNNHAERTTPWNAPAPVAKPERPAA